MRYVTVFVVVLGTCAPAADGAPCPAEAGWHYTTLDGGDDWTGHYSSLEFDSQGNPHITYVEYVDYYPYGNTDLVYIRWTGDEWVEEMRYFGEYGVGKWCDLELDANDLPHVAYTTGTDSPYDWHLGYSFFDGAQWHHEVVDDREVMGTHASLELDSQGHPHIAYDEYYGGLWYASHDGSGWNFQHLDEDPNMHLPYPSLELDRNDYPHISYCRQTSNSGHLLYVYWDGSQWVYQDVGPTCWTLNSSLELDSSDHPHIAFANNEGSDGLEFYLRYAHYDGSEWEYETVDDDGLTGQYISLALDSRDNPSISYQCDGPLQQEVLRYARRTPHGWETEVVDDTSLDTGRNTCLKMDSNDNPHITYMDNEHVDLRYAWYGGVADAGLTAEVCDEGVLIGWTVTGDMPAGLCVLRSVDDGEPTAVSGALPGSAVRWLDMEVDVGVEYYYWLEVTDPRGGRNRFGPTEPVAFPGPGRELALSVHPNPASDSVTFECTLPEDMRVTVSLYDLSGRRVDTVIEGEMAAGRHEVVWDASVARPGVYLVRLSADSGSLTRRVVVAR